MPRRIPVGTLVTSCKQQVDLENHSVISAAEWLSLVNRAYGELYTIVFESGLQYFEYSANLTTDGTNVLSEMVDHLSTVNLSYVVNATAGQYRDLRELMAQERSGMSGLTGDCARFFSLVDDKIYLYPTPPIGQVYQMRYVPQPPDLGTFASDTCADVVTPDGHEFLIWSVAVKALVKVESDPREAINEREAARIRFTESVQLRALNAPRRRIVDLGEDYESERFGW